MINDSRVLAIIVGRGGSKGLPRKNVRELGGKPMIAWSIEAAARSVFIDRAIVSTDDAEIADAARRWGGDVPFLRPDAMASDVAPVIDTILHTVDALAVTYSYIVLLQATSPLRLGSDIDAALAHCVKTGAPSCISIVPAPKARWTIEMDAAGKLLLPPDIVKPRQDFPDAYQPNGAIYIAELELLRRNRDFYTAEAVGYVMPPERSVDIDTMLDFRLAETLLADKG